MDLATSGPSTSAGSSLTVGVAALIHSLHPEWTYSQIKNQILSTVDQLPSLAGKTVTGGRLNAATAVSASSIHITDPSILEGDSGTTELVFTVSRRGDISQVLTVDWTTTDGTATAGSDYAASSGTLTYSASETTKNIVVTINGDLLDEANETVFINLSNPSSGILADPSGQGTINSDDVQISIDDVTVTEGDETGHYRGSFVDQPVGLNFNGLTFGPDGSLYTSNSSGGGAIDRYDGMTGEFIETLVPSGRINGVRDPIFRDGLLYVGAEYSDEVLRFNATTGEFVDVFVTAGSGGIDGPHGMTFGPDSNFDGIPELYVTGRNSANVVRYDGETGLPLGSYVTSGSGGLSSPEGLTFDPTESFVLVASSGSGAVLKYDALTGAYIGVGAGSPVSGPKDVEFGSDGLMYVASSGNDRIIRFTSDGSFIDDFVPAGVAGMDDPNRLAFGADGDLFVSGPGIKEIMRFSTTPEAVFTVSLSIASILPITVDFVAADGTAVAGGDYDAATGTVTFAPGVTSRTILVQTIDDAIEESSETFFVNLSNPSFGAKVADAQGVATINDDDVPAGISVTGVSPNSASQNQQLTVAVTGTGFVDGATIDFGNRVNVLDVTYVNSTQLDVLIKVHRKATTGSRDVTVTNPDSSSATLNSGFTVTAALLAETTGDGNGIIPLSQDDAEAFAELALQLWIGAEGIFDVSNFDVIVADLPGNQLGMFDGNVITLDVNAAGVGWFIDSTPFDNSEFALGVNGYDLLTAATHEVGHALGFNHDHEGVMVPTLAVGERHLPGEEHHPESETLVIPVFDLNTQDDSTSYDSLGTGGLASLQPLAEKSSYALETVFDTSLTNDDFDSSEPIPYLPEEDLDADSFFSEFENSLLDDLLAIS